MMPLRVATTTISMPACRVSVAAGVHRTWSPTTRASTRQSSDSMSVPMVSSEATVEPSAAEPASTGTRATIRTCLAFNGMLARTCLPTAAAAKAGAASADTLREL